jgi:hypothetical protein
MSEGFHFRESDHAYFLDGKKMTGCTTILNVISKPLLIPWASRMAVEYAGKHIKAGKKYTEEELAQIFEDAKKAHAQKRDKAADEGTATHAIVEEYIKDCIEKHDGKPINDYDSDDPILQFKSWAVENGIRFLESEKKYYSRELFVAGTADFTFEKDGKRYIGDIKCKDKIWSREPFFQCAGYSIMAEEMGEPKYSGYVVVRLKGGEIEPLWSFDTEGDKKAFLAAVTIYRQLANFTK